MSEFNVSMAADLMLANVAQYSTLVLPNLTQEQAAEVAQYATDKAAREASAKGRDALKRQCLPDARDDLTVDAFYDSLATVAAHMREGVAHKAAEQEGGWSGRTVRSIPVMGGTIKVTYTDSKPPRK